MKAVDFIKIVRDDCQELYDLHNLAVETNGEQGSYCLNLDEFLKKMNRTDKEILDYYISQGAEIDDVEKYLLSLDNQ